MEKIENKKNLTDNKIINKKIQNKNTILKNQTKIIQQRKKIIHHSNGSYVPNVLNKEIKKEKIIPSKTINNFSKIYNLKYKTNLNKPNSCESRKKFGLKYEKTINQFNNKSRNIEHKKILSISPDINNYKKVLNHFKTNKKDYFNSLIYKSINHTNDNFFKKDQFKIKNTTNTLAVNQTILKNKSNKNNKINNSKLLNKSVELRNKIKNLKLKNEPKINKIIKTKTNIINNKKEKLSKIINNDFINKENIFNTSECDSENEKCQTFSNKGNAETNENLDINDSIFNESEPNKTEVLKIINNNEKSTKDERILAKNSISINEAKTRDIAKNIKEKKEYIIPKNQKMKYLIKEFCIGSKKNNKKNINKNFSNKCKTSINPKKNDYILDLTNPKFSDKNEKLSRNNEIFEVISDIKVKTFNEYEQELVQKTEQSINLENKSQINNNININININYNNINVNNNSNNDINNDFIKDRDEYNTNIKATFSKDRFSFRPINNNYNLEQYNISGKNNQKLNKDDFIDKNKNEKEIKKYSIINNKKIGKNHLNPKEKLNKTQKRKNIIKIKPKPKTNKGVQLFNKSFISKKKK